MNHLISPSPPRTSNLKKRHSLFMTALYRLRDVQSVASSKWNEKKIIIYPVIAVTSRVKQKKHLMVENLTNILTNMNETARETRELK